MNTEEMFDLLTSAIGRSDSCEQLTTYISNSGEIKLPHLI